MGLPQQAKVKDNPWKHTDSLIKKKFWVQWSVKKVMLTVFWSIKEPIIDFFEKRCNCKQCFLLPTP